MNNLKILLSLSFLLLNYTINAMQEQDKENKNLPVQELLAEYKSQQQIPLRPSTPLNPHNSAHRHLINVLQTEDGRPVTAIDCYLYLGFNPTR